MATVIVLDPATPQDVTITYPTVSGGANEINAVSEAIQAAEDAQEDRDAVEDIRDDMTATTSLAYREFTDDGSAPSAPVAGRLRLYFDDEQLKTAVPAGTLGGPYHNPTYTTGSITVSTTDDFRDIMTRHEGGSYIDFNNGTYDFSIAATGTISAASWLAGSATITHDGGRFIAGESVTISGVGRAGYNGTFTITSSTSTTLVYTVADPGGTSSGGTAAGRKTSNWTPENTNILLRSVNVGGAILKNLRIVTHGKRVFVDGFNLIPPDDGTYFFFVQAGSDLEFSDCVCDISAFGNSTATFGATTNSNIGIKASGTSGRTRNSTWTLGSRVTTQIFDVDSASSVKFGGDLTKQVTFTHTNTLTGLILDASFGIVASTSFLNTGSVGGTAILLRRNSGLVVSNDCVIDNYDVGLRASSGGGAYVESTTFSNCNSGIQLDAGGRAYTEDNCTFTTNVVDRDNSTSGTDLFIHNGPVATGDRFAISTDNDLRTAATVLEIIGSTVETVTMTATISGTTVTATSVTGTPAVGDRLFGSAIGDVEFNTTITAIVTPYNAIGPVSGVYTINNTQTVAAPITIYASAGANNTVRITETDPSARIAQPLGALEFYGSDASLLPVGVKAYIAATAQTTGADSALLFGTAPSTASTQAVERMRLDRSGNLGIGTKTPTSKLDVSDDRIRVRTAKTPASASATGNAGDICWDSSYIYVCTATDTWKRVAIATW